MAVSLASMLSRVKKFVIVFWFLSLFLTLTACGTSELQPGASAAAVQCSYAPAGEPAKPVDPPSGNDVASKGETSVTLQMTEGEVTIAMNRQTAPCAVNSFEALAQQGYYNETRCHRLTDQGIFILQCGDPTGTGTGGPGYAFADELDGSETYSAGTVAMANAGPNTNGSQFFMVWADSELPPSYTVIGRLDEASLKVIQDIASQGVDAEQAPRPISEARIKSVTMG